MFIAMNRFRVKKGSEEAFGKVWLTRDNAADQVPGFVEFHLLIGPSTRTSRFLAHRLAEQGGVVVKESAHLTGTVTDWAAGTNRGLCSLTQAGERDG